MCWFAANVTDVAVLRAIHSVRERADPDQIMRLVQRERIARRSSAFARRDLAGDSIDDDRCSATLYVAPLLGEAPDCEADVMAAESE